jgi:hypothetical protein
MARPSAGILKYLFTNVQHVYKTHHAFITNKKEYGDFISYYFIIVVKLKSSYEIRILRGICFCWRSWWSRDLRHELSLPARTLGSCFRIPLEAWMTVCVYSVCAVLCVDSGLETGRFPVQGVLPTVCRITKLKKRPGPNKGL